MDLSFAALAPEYGRLWAQMRTQPDHVFEFDVIAKRLYTHNATYHAIAVATGVPVCMIAVIHSREADGDFGAYLGNGQPYSRVTTEVPVGRGPFPDFISGAIDALHIDGLDAVRDWTVERALYMLEKYNGFGYRQYHAEPSPYLWAGSNIQETGKYEADGKFNRTAYDTQLGCAPLMAALWVIDPSLRLPSLADALPTPVAPTPRPPAPLPPTALPVRRFPLWEAIVAFFRFLRSPS